VSTSVLPDIMPALLINEEVYICTLLSFLCSHLYGADFYKPDS